MQCLSGREAPPHPASAPPAPAGLPEALPPVPQLRTPIIPMSVALDLVVSVLNVRAWAWLPLGILVLKLIRAVGRVAGLFLFIAEGHLFVQISHPWSVCWHLGSFQLCPLMNKADADLHVHVFSWIISTHFCGERSLAQGCWALGQHAEFYFF